MSADDKILAFLPKLYFPSSVFWGEKAPSFLRTLKEEKKLLVVSGTFEKANGNLIDTLFEEKIERFLQDREPLLDDFEKLKDFCLKHGFTYLVALGGGSVIDLAKLVKRDLKIKMAAIPTTIGSGAEVSQHALLIGQDGKKIFSSPDLLPETVIINPVYLKSLSQEQVIFGTIDGLAHGLESLVSKMANPLSDALALQAISNFYLNLDQLKDSENFGAALPHIQIASFLAGLAQSSAGSGLAHALAHYFGAKNKISHSRAVAIFLLDVLRLNSQHTAFYEKLDQLKYLSSANFIEILEKLFVQLKVKPESIILPGDLESTAAVIKRDICALTNPYSPAAEEIINILKRHSL